MKVYSFSFKSSNTDLIQLYRKKKNLIKTWTKTQKQKNWRKTQTKQTQKNDKAQQLNCLYTTINNSNIFKQTKRHKTNDGQQYKYKYK